MMATKGQAIRVAMKEIPTLGRAAQGVRIMRMSEGDTVASIGIVLPEETPEEVFSDKTEAKSDNKIGVKTGNDKSTK